jgi:hypothetical protein
MAFPQSSFIIEKMPTFGGNFVDSQYLAASYRTGQPAMLDRALTYIFSSKSNFFPAKLITNMTGGKSNGTLEIDNEVYRWRLQGAEEIHSVVMENLEASNPTPGINNSTFRVKLNFDFYDVPDVLMGEDPEYPVAVLSKMSDGTGTIYTMQLQSDNPALFIPQSMLQPGKRFSKVWTTVASEFNREFGTQQYPNTFLLESQVGAFAQKLTITDKAWRDEGKLAFKFMYEVDGKTKVADRFLPMAEAKMWNELYKSMEVQSLYGQRSTKPSKDGYWKKTGPGLRAQLKDSWIDTYNGPLSVNNLKDFILDIFVPRTNETDRKSVWMTGTAGSLLLHDALVAISNCLLNVDTHYIQKVASPVDTPHLAFGAQFTRYNGPEGICIDIIKNPLYDSFLYDKRPHPDYPNLPIDSARFTALNLGKVDGQQNILQLKVKDTFRHGYMAGTHTQLRIAA